MLVKKEKSPNPIFSAYVPVAIQDIFWANFCMYSYIAEFLAILDNLFSSLVNATSNLKGW